MISGTYTVFFSVARPGNVVRRATTPEEDPETILAKKMMVILNITRMKTFIKTKFKKLDDQTNIDNLH